MNLEEKLEIAHHLAKLNVDIIEAGFPVSSPGDFDAVERIANEVKGPEICALSRIVEKDITAAWGQSRMPKSLVSIPSSAHRIFMLPESLALIVRQY